MDNSRIKGELEIDHDRGVIYFHADSEKVCIKYGSVSILRIGGLPKPIKEKAIDIILPRRKDRSSTEPDRPSTFNPAEKWKERTGQQLSSIKPNIDGEDR